MYVHVTHTNRGPGHTKTVKGKYCNVVIDHCIDHENVESRSSIFQGINLINKSYSKGLILSSKICIVNTQIIIQFMIINTDRFRNVS